MSQGWVITQLERVLAGNIECLPHQREHLSLLDRVDPQVRLEIQVGIQHVARVSGLVTDQFEHRLHGVAATGRGYHRRHQRRWSHCRRRRRNECRLSRRSRDHGRRSLRPRCRHDWHGRAIAHAGARARAHGPGRLSRLARRLANVLDAQGTLLNFQDRRRVSGDLRQPALVGNPIRYPLFETLNATEHGHRDLRTKTGGQAQGVAHRIVSALRQIERAQFRIGLAVVGHRRNDLPLQNLDRHCILHAHPHGMTSEALGVAHHQVVGAGAKGLAQSKHLGRGAASTRWRVGLVRNEDQLARHCVSVYAVTPLHA